MCLDRAEDLYVADGCWERIFVYSNEGNPLRWWGTPKSCRGIAVSGSDRVYATQPQADDASGSSVFLFTATGGLAARWNANGTGPGEFYGPVGVAVDDGGDVFVTEQGNARVQRLTAEGEPITQWGGRGAAPGQFGDPEGIALGPDGLVYVTDADNQTIQVFTKTGDLVRWWGGVLGSGPGQFHGLRGIALDALGNVYVADTGNHRIQVFSSTGAFLTQWGSYGSDPGQFDNPVSILVTRDGRIFVGDFNARIQVFGPAPTPASSRTWGQVKVLYR